jgi:hypothetical protein
MSGQSPERLDNKIRSLRSDAANFNDSRTSNAYICPKVGHRVRSAEFAQGIPERRDQVLSLSPATNISDTLIKQKGRLAFKHGQGVVVAGSHSRSPPSPDGMPTD